MGLVEGVIYGRDPVMGWLLGQGRVRLGKGLEGKTTGKREGSFELGSHTLASHG